MPNFFKECESSHGTIELDSTLTSLHYRIVGFNPKHLDRIRVNLRLSRDHLHAIYIVLRQETVL